MAKFDGSTPGPGRPKGSRNKLGEAFIEAVYQDFKEHGIAAVQKMRDEDVSGYVKVVAGILPKEIHAEIEHRSVVHVPKVAETIEEWLKPSRGSPALPRNLNS